MTLKPFIPMRLTRNKGSNETIFVNKCLQANNVNLLRENILENIKYQLNYRLIHRITQQIISYFIFVVNIL